MVGHIYVKIPGAAENKLISFNARLKTSIRKRLPSRCGSQSLGVVVDHRTHIRTLFKRPHRSTGLPSDPKESLRSPPHHYPRSLYSGIYSIMRAYKTLHEEKRQRSRRNYIDTFEIMRARVAWLCCGLRASDADLLISVACAAILAEAVVYGTMLVLYVAHYVRYVCMLC